MIFIFVLYIYIIFPMYHVIRAYLINTHQYINCWFVELYVVSKSVENLTMKNDNWELITKIIWEKFFKVPLSAISFTRKKNDSYLNLKFSINILVLYV